MKELTLERWAYTPMGTFGTLTLPEFRCYTVERPWLDNRRWVSCIPQGTYTLCLGYFSRGGYKVYELTDVSSRDLIKIHRGNTMDDVHGCIAVGRALGWIHDKWAVTDSAWTLDQFMNAMDGWMMGELTIVDCLKEGPPR